MDSGINNFKRRIWKMLNIIIGIMIAIVIIIAFIQMRKNIK